MDWTGKSQCSDIVSANYLLVPFGLGFCFMYFKHVRVLRHVCVFTTCVPGVFRHQKRMSGPMRKELHIAVNYQVGARN